MKCNRCETVMRFSAKNDMFFYTPEDKKPCEDCIEMFKKVAQWQKDIPVTLKLEAANELNSNLAKMTKATNAMISMLPKKNRSLLERIKRLFYIKK